MVGGGRLFHCVSAKHSCLLYWLAWPLLPDFPQLHFASLLLHPSNVCKYVEGKDVKSLDNLAGYVSQITFTQIAGKVYVIGANLAHTHKVTVK